MESTRSSSNKWTKNSTKINYLHCITNFCATVLNIFLRKIISTNTNVENECWTSYETLASSGEIKLMMKFCLSLHKISEHWNLFSLVPMGNRVWCYFGQLFMYLALRKRENDWKILKITLVQILSTKTWNCSIFYRIPS